MDKTMEMQIEDRLINEYLEYTKTDDKVYRVIGFWMFLNKFLKGSYAELMPMNFKPLLTDNEMEFFNDLYLNRFQLDSITGFGLNERMSLLCVEGVVDNLYDENKDIDINTNDYLQRFKILLGREYAKS